CVYHQLHQRTATPGLLARLLQSAIAEELSELIGHYDSSVVDVVFGEPRMIEPGSFAVHHQGCGSVAFYESRAIVIGTGLRWACDHSPSGVQASRGPESLLTGTRLPFRVTILGGHSFGVGLASLLSQIGVISTVVGDIDQDDVSVELAISSGVDAVSEESADDSILIESAGNVVIDCRRAVGLTSHLSLRSIGVEADENGRLWCDANLQTWGRGIYGIGDVVGFSTRCGSSLNDEAGNILGHVLRQHRAALTGWRSDPVVRSESCRRYLVSAAVMG
ncbi:MAG: hypothetical protein ACK58L_15145, partial [Planctomycetota bacterium]